MRLGRLCRPTKTTHLRAGECGRCPGRMESRKESSQRRDAPDGSRAADTSRLEPVLVCSHRTLQRDDVLIFLES